MKGKILILILIGSSLFVNCKGDKKPEAESGQMEEVMAIHDEIMPKMGDIGKLVDQLKARADSTDTGKKYEQAMHDLQEAHMAMMEWMQNFGKRFDSSEILDGKALSEEKQQWLDEEEARVKALKEQINNSIARAEELLQQ